MEHPIRARALDKLRQIEAAEAVALHEVQRITGRYQELELAQDASRLQAERYQQAIAALNLLIERHVTRKLDQLTQDVNRALAAIIPDQDLKFQVFPDIKYNKQSYRFAVLHDGVPRNGVEGIGGTVLAIVSLVLRVMCIKETRRYPLIVLDESLRFVSRSYKARASMFVRALAEKLGVHVLLITHDLALAEAADINYTVRPAAGDQGAEVVRLTKAELLAYFRADLDDGEEPTEGDWQAAAERFRLANTPTEGDWQAAAERFRLANTPPA